MKPGISKYNKLEGVVVYLKKHSVTQYLTLQVKGLVSLQVKSLLSLRSAHKTNISA